MKTKLPLLFILIFLTAISSYGQKYHKANFKRMGYNETQISSDKYNVTYRWTGYWTNKTEIIVDFCLLRCAELTLMNGYKYFKVLESNEGDDHHDGKTDLNVVVNITKTIKMLNDESANDDNVYEAKFLENSIKTKYKIR